MANKARTKLGRPIRLAEPLGTLVKQLGGIRELRDQLNNVAPSTIHRWSDKLRAGEPLPPLVALALQTLQEALAKEAPCPKTPPARKVKPTPKETSSASSPSSPPIQVAPKPIPLPTPTHSTLISKVVKRDSAPTSPK